MTIRPNLIALQDRHVSRDPIEGIDIKSSPKQGSLTIVRRLPIV